MKIAVVTEIISNRSGAKAPVALAKALSKNHQVGLFAFALNSDKALIRTLQHAGIRVTIVQKSPILQSKWLAAFKMTSLLKEYQIISFHGTLPAFVAAKLAGRPIVKTYYGTQTDAYLERFLPSQPIGQARAAINRLLNQLILLIDRVFFELSDKSVGISRYTASQAKILFGKNIPYIWLGADSFPTAGTKRQTSGPTRLVSVSRLTPYKNFHLLLDLLNNLERPVTLTICGQAVNSGYAAYLKRFSHPNCRIITNADDHRLAQIYQNADIYVSADRFLFFGLPVVEAAFFSKPAVIFDYCAAREIVRHGQTGYVTSDKAEFCSYLRRLIDQPLLRRRFGKAAKALAQQQFTWDQCARQYERLLKKMVTKRP